MIIEMTNEHADFYQRLGPFLARRDIYRELGGPPWDEEGKRWFVDVHRGSVRGFCAWRTKGARVVLSSAYVAPEARRKGVYRKLFAARWETIPVGSTVIAVARPEAVPVLAAAGLVEESRSKGYISMRGTR